MPAPIDITGKTFGKLTALRRESGSMWIWRCGCGVEKVISSPAIKAGLVVSCGCNKADRARENGKKATGRPVDRAGIRYGMLIALERVGTNEHKKPLWRCICDCGKETVVTSGHLASGHTNSCGCARDRRLVIRNEQVRQQRVAQQSERRRTDIRYALKGRMQSAIWHSLRGKKSDRLEVVLGYTITALRKRLENTMPAGYSWDDFLSGRLHIDHWTPLSAFNFEKESDLDFRRAWALKNLRLLPGPDNIAKRDKIEGPFQPSLRF